METLPCGLPWRCWWFWHTSHADSVHQTYKLCQQIPVTPHFTSWKHEPCLSFPTRSSSRLGLQVICKGRKGRWCPVVGWMDEGQRGWLFFSYISIHPHHHAGKRGPRGGQCEGWCPGCQRASFPAHNGQTTVTTLPMSPVFAEGRNGFVLWLLTPVHYCGWLSVLSLLSQGKPQAIQWFDPDVFILSASSCHLHSVQKILIGNFIRHAFNSFNSSVNRQLPLLSNCLTHFLSEQSPGLTRQYFLFTFSTSSDIFPFLAEASS